MADRDTDELLRGQLSRRGILKCMTWAGTGVLWTLSGGMPRSIGLVDEASAAPPPAGAFTFLQISDTHLRSPTPANPTPPAPPPKPTPTTHPTPSHPPSTL